MRGYTSGTSTATRTMRCFTANMRRRDETDATMERTCLHVLRSIRASAAGRALAALVSLIAALALLTPLGARDARAQAIPQDTGAVRIHVKGSAQIQVTATTDGSALTIRGALIDDAGTPIAAAPLSIQAAPAEPGDAPIALPTPRACEARARGARVRASRDEYLLETDEHGEFCVRTDALIPKTSIRVRFLGTTLHDAADARAPLDAVEARSARTRLRFEPAIEMIDLDRESVPVSGSLKFDRSELLVEANTKREGLVIALEDERGAKIAEAPTGGDGRARFEIKTASLDAPGRGELTLRFDGAPGLAKASATLPIIRRAEVNLALAHPLDSADPEDGVPIDVEVSSSRGAVDGGVVEALRGVESVGAGAVSAGKARLIASFSVDRPGNAPLTIRYVPAAPWWRAGTDLRVEVRVAGAGLGRQLLLALIVVAVTAWVIAGWRRAPKPKPPKEGDATAAPPSGRAAVQVVAPSVGQSGWRGVVSDAHDGTPVHGATLSIIVPTFEGDGVAARATTDERGAFTFEGVSSPNMTGARLLVQSRDYSSYEQALPPPSVLAVSLVTRRRALLDRLTRWARRQGAPFDGPPEPTPGHVRRVASRTNIAEVEAWAQKVEQTAFGPDLVDEQLEQEVRAAEPKGGRP